MDCGIDDVVTVQSVTRSPVNLANDAQLAGNTRDRFNETWDILVRARPNNENRRACVVEDPRRVRELRKRGIVYDAYIAAVCQTEFVKSVFGCRRDNRYHAGAGHRQPVPKQNEKPAFQALQPRYRNGVMHSEHCSRPRQQKRQEVCIAGHMQHISATKRSFYGDVQPAEEPAARKSRDHNGGVNAGRKRRRESSIQSLVTDISRPGPSQEKRYFDCL